MDINQSITTSAKKEKSNLSTVLSVVKCTSYDQEQVDGAIRQSLQNVGGLDRFIKPGDKVHIKPNLLTAKTPERASTTHPAVVCSVVKMVQKSGGIVTIGDSPSGISRPIEEYWRNSGLEKVAADTGAKLVRFEKNAVSARIVNGNTYYIANAVAEADVVISISKLKTHNLTLYTGAIKNMFGSIPGFRKSEYHKQAPMVDEFSKIIVDIFSVVKPQLNIMDAVVAMEGNGPSAGRPKEMGLILTSTDAVAIDSIAESLLGFEDGEIETTEIAYQQGLGEKRREKIIVKGESLEKYENLNFSLPSNRFLNYIPKTLITLVGKLLWVRPEPQEKRCKRCGDCIKNCPTRAMISKDGFPIIDYDKCINCFCCDEICPHDAIDQKMSWLARKFS